MASQRDIKRRITSVQNTRKITKAMEMVAAARLRRAQTRIEATRPYALLMMEFIAGLARDIEVDPEQFPLLKVHEQVRRVAIVALTGDRGLSGAFNANVIRATIEMVRKYKAQGIEVELFVAGRKGVGTFRFQGYEHRAYTGFTDRPDFSDAQAIAHRLADLYIAERIDRVHLIYNHFKSAMDQYVTEQILLPIQEEIAPEFVPQEATIHSDFLFEPPAPVILKELLPGFVEMAVYRALLESAASELGARMTAMRNASESAADMIDSLTLAMNRVRQASITQEILEVVAGADALT